MALQTIPLITYIAVVTPDEVGQAMGNYGELELPLTPLLRRESSRIKASF